MQELLATEASRVWQLRCATVMPDHTHLLIRLGAALTLSQAVARLKVATKGTLAAQTAQWQANYYDHRIRSDEAIEPVIRYIHSNPYRAGLLRRDEIWPWFYCSPDDWAWFSQLTDEGAPFPEWLQ
ncbi:MAG: hypothetical protein JWQ83_1882 [Lacunisphaera sp.]|nr:hypothetical protein [Lacunisphaera sp.]